MRNFDIVTFVFLVLLSLAGPAAAQACELCHEATGEDHPGKKGAFRLLASGKDLCYQCHDDNRHLQTTWGCLPRNAAICARRCKYYRHFAGLDNLAFRRQQKQLRLRRYREYGIGL